MGGIIEEIRKIIAGELSAEPGDATYEVRAKERLEAIKAILKQNGITTQAQIDNIKIFFSLIGEFEFISEWVQKREGGQK